jgi:hypothetical protein
MDFLLFSLEPVLVRMNLPMVYPLSISLTIMVIVLPSTCAVSCGCVLRRPFTRSTPKIKNSSFIFCHPA